MDPHFIKLGRRVVFTWCSPDIFLTTRPSPDHPLCNEPLPSDLAPTNVCIDARVPPQSEEQKPDNIPLITPSAEKKYFPIFNQDLPRQLTGRGKQSKIRKMKSTPANNSRITDHFIPTRTNSKKRDDENIHLAPASVDRCLLSSSPVTRSPDVSDV